MDSIKNRLLSNQAYAEYYDTRGDSAKRDYYKNRANDDVVLLANMNGTDDESDVMNNITLTAIKKFYNKPLELLNKLPYIKREFISKYSNDITTVLKRQYGSNPSLGQIMDVINSMYRTSQESKTTQMKENKTFDDKVNKEIELNQQKTNAKLLIDKYLAGDDVDPIDLESAKALLNPKEKARLNERTNKQDQFGKQLQLRSKQEQGKDIDPSELAELDDFDTNDPEYVGKSFGALGVKYINGQWKIKIDGTDVVIDNPYELLSPMAVIVENESNIGRKKKLISAFKSDLIEKIKSENIAKDADTVQDTKEDDESSRKTRIRGRTREILEAFNSVHDPRTKVLSYQVDRKLNDYHLTTIEKKSIKDKFVARYPGNRGDFSDRMKYLAKYVATKEINKKEKALRIISRNVRRGPRAPHG